MMKKVLILSLIALMILSINIGANAKEGGIQQYNLPNLGHAKYSVEKALDFSVYASESVEEQQETKSEEQVPADEEQAPADEEQALINPEQQDTSELDYDKPVVALTFDDGTSEYTPEILEVLRENNSKATFFVVGSSVNKYKDTLNQIINEGNEIGNHTYNHKDLTTVTDEELYKQVKGTDDLIYSATGYTPAIMRPPYGASDDELNKKILKPVIKWSVDTRDWENRNTEMIVNEILENVQDGDIVLMHDLYESTAEAAKIVIPELVERGYQLVTVSEMSEYRGISLTEGEQFYNMYIN